MENSPVVFVYVWAGEKTWGELLNHKYFQQEKSVKGRTYT